MILRDKLNTKEGYTELIIRNEEYITEELNFLESQEVNSDITKLKYTNSLIFKYSLKVLESKFSLGKLRNDLQENIEKMSDSFICFWGAESGYYYVLDIISLSILFNTSENCFKKIVELVDKEGLQDFVIDFLISSRYPERPISEKVLWKKPYQGIYEIVEASKESKEVALKRLEKYLQKEWYRHYDGKDTHKSEWNIHTGYWSFESGAIAKILGLDDSSLKEQQYYPYDMVHF